MPGKFGMWVVAVIGAVAVGGCGHVDLSASKASDCATSEAATACFVRESGQNHFEVSGFHRAQTSG